MNTKEEYIGSFEKHTIESQTQHTAICYTTTTCKRDLGAAYRAQS